MSKPDPRKPILITEEDKPITAAEALTISINNQDDSGARSLLRDIMKQIRHYATYGHQSVYLSLAHWQLVFVGQVKELLEKPPYNFRVDVEEQKDFWNPATSEVESKCAGITVIWAPQESAELKCGNSLEDLKADAQHTANIQSAGLVESVPIPKNWVEEVEDAKYKALKAMLDAIPKDDALAQLGCQHGRVELVRVLGRFEAHYRCLDCGKEPV